MEVKKDDSQSYSKLEDASLRAFDLCVEQAGFLQNQMNR